MFKSCVSVFPVEFHNALFIYDGDFSNPVTFEFYSIFIGINARACGRSLSGRRFWVKYGTVIGFLVVRFQGGEKCTRGFEFV